MDNLVSIKSITMQPIRKLPGRAVVYSRDIRNIFGVKERAARYMMAKLKRMLQKGPGQVVTVQELSLCTGVSE